MTHKKIAFLVIPGVGQHRPLECLDRFVRGIAATLQHTAAESAGGSVRLSHHLDELNGRADGFVRIDAAVAQAIDVYEYYWPHGNTARAGLVQVIDWLIDASAGAKTFYEANFDRVGEYERPLAKAFHHQQMTSNWYLARIGGLFRAMALIDQVFPASYWVRAAGLLKAGLMPVLRFVHRDLATMLLSYAGDVVAYTRHESRQASHRFREDIVAGLQTTLAAIEASAESYDHIVIAAHSMGSVLAYDAINAVIRDLNRSSSPAQPAHQSRLSGLLTFGSPLDKVAFILRYHGHGDDYVRRQLIEQRHGFRLRLAADPEGYGERASLENPYTVSLDDQIQWINYWDVEDLVGGHLDCYRVDENVECEMGGGWLENHARYWDYLPMYQDIARRFLGVDGAH